MNRLDAYFQPLEFADSIWEPPTLDETSLVDLVALIDLTDDLDVPPPIPSWTVLPQPDRYIKVWNLWELEWELVPIFDSCSYSDQIYYSVDEEGEEGGDDDEEELDAETILRRLVARMLREMEMASVQFVSSQEREHNLTFTQTPLSPLVGDPESNQSSEEIEYSTNDERSEWQLRDSSRDESEVDLESVSIKFR